MSTSLTEINKTLKRIEDKIGSIGSPIVIPQRQPANDQISQATLASMLTELQTHTTHLLTLIADVDQLEGYTDGLEGFVDQLEGYTDQLESYVDGVEGLLSTIDARISSGNITTHAKLDTLETTLTNIETDSASIAAEDFATQTTLSALYTNTDTKLSAIEAKLNTIDADTGIMQAKLTNIDSSIDQLELDMDSLIAKDYSTETTLDDFRDKFDVLGSMGLLIVSLEATLLLINAKLTDGGSDVAAWTNAIETTCNNIETDTGNIDTELATWYPGEYVVHTITLTPGSLRGTSTITDENCERVVGMNVTSDDATLRALEVGIVASGTDYAHASENVSSASSPKNLYEWADHDHLYNMMTVGDGSVAWYAEVPAITAAKTIVVKILCMVCKT